MNVRAPVLLLAIPLLYAGLARGAEYGVLNGATLNWVFDETDLTYDALKVSYGAVSISGTHYSVGSNSLIITAGTHKNAIFDGNVTQQAHTAYYVYQAVTTVGNTTTVISTTAPWTDCYPSANLVFTANTVKYTETTAAFLGSYITDSQGGIVPFFRNGSSVIFANGEGGSTVSDFPGAVATATINWTNSAHAAAAISFGTAAIPVSASALLIDLRVQNTDTASNFVDISGGLWSGGVAANFLQDMANIFVPASSVVQQGLVPIFTATTDATPHAAPAGTSQLNLHAGYHGYIEDVIHPLNH